MMTVVNNIYQTGQRVPVSGNYEVVGVNLATARNKKEKALRLMQRGEIFPNYEGWEVCWHYTAGDHQSESEKASTGTQPM